MKALPVRIPRIRRPKRRRPAPGAAPGTLVPHPELPPAKVTRHCFNAEGADTRDATGDDLAEALRTEPGKVVWIDVEGLGSVEVIRRIGEILGLHPLTLEDIVHVHQRRKLEEFQRYLYSCLRLVRVTADGHVDDGQVSFVLQDGLLVTFQ